MKYTKKSYEGDITNNNLTNIWLNLYLKNWVYANVQILNKNLKTIYVCIYVII